MTALFRSIILMALFTLAGFLIRWYFLKVVTSIEPGRMEKFEEMVPEEEGVEEELIEGEEPGLPGVAENVEQNNLT